ncbi:4'-phosphopantetheinyl transferase superfamily protein [Paenibacillus sp. FSL P2-0136]|uniref:4'-phosphopantetheinyl transferase family protein n=1 Tax=Paenibacillus sp. FSL P2-0136 TaxID=2975317 RepID=UPI0030DAD22E
MKFQSQCKVNVLKSIEMNEESVCFPISVDRKIGLTFVDTPANFNASVLQSHLHPQEMNYYKGLITDKRIFSYMIGRYVAKRSVSLLTEERLLERIWIDQGILNQPILRYANLCNHQVSISHSGGLAVGLVYPESFPMGIDLEVTPSLRKANLIKSYMTESEIMLAKRIIFPFNEVITLLWTMKEALSKVLRVGLTTPLSLLEINKLELSSKGFVTGSYTHFTQYSSYSYIGEEFISSIVVPKQLAWDGQEFKQLFHSFSQNHRVIGEN